MSGTILPTLAKWNIVTVTTDHIPPRSFCGNEKITLGPQMSFLTVPKHVGFAYDFHGIDLLLLFMLLMGSVAVRM
jgi:hypothetical protein